MLIGSVLAVPVYATQGGDCKKNSVPQYDVCVAVCVANTDTKGWVDPTGCKNKCAGLKPE